MAKPKHFSNRSVGLSGSIRATTREAIPAGSVVCVTGLLHSNVMVVSLADSRSKKKSQGLLFIAKSKCAQGGRGEFVTHLVLPLNEEAKVGDPVVLKSGGKWSLKETKTSKQIGVVIEGRDDALHALLAPQGRY